MNGCGVRISELLSLRVKDITFKGESKGRIFIKDSKGGQHEEASFKTNEITDQVYDYVKANGKEDNDYLFTNRSKEPY